MIERVRRIHYGALAALLLIATVVTSISIPSSALAYAGGNGTEGNPWQIANCTQLQGMNAGGASYADDHYLLTANINCGGNFNEIHFNSDSALSGEFDGAGYTISNVTVVGTSQNTNGIFSSIDGGTVKNLTLTNIISTGYDGVGTLAGRVMNGATIENVHVTSGTVTGTGVEETSVGGLVGRSEWSSYSNVTANVDVTADATWNVGGLIGSSFIDDLYQTATHGDVSGYQEVGGLIGYRECSGNGDRIISQSFTTGSVTSQSTMHGNVGGLIGNIAPNECQGVRVTDSYARGEVTGVQNAGGLVGSHEGQIITNSYSTGAISSSSESAGGLVGVFGEWSESAVNSFWDTQTSGKSGSADGTGKTTTQMKAAATFTDELFDDSWDFDSVWMMNADANDGYPCLRWSDESCGENTGGSEGDGIETITTGTVTNITPTGARVHGTAQLTNGQTIDDMIFNEGDLMLGFHFNTSQLVDWDNYTHSAPVMTVSPINGNTTHLSFYADYDELECNTQYWYVAAYDYSDSDAIGIADNVLSFTTAACDDDNDGVASDIESTAPNGGDGNNDGTPDAEQAHVTSLLSPVNQKYVTLEVDESCTLSDVSIADASSHASKDNTYMYQSGFVNFTATGCDENVANVKLYYHGVSQDNMIARKYNPTTNSYFTIEAATIAAAPAPLGGTLVTYAVHDNGELDIDSTDGVIVDPVGLAVNAPVGASVPGAPNTGFAPVGHAFGYALLSALAVVAAASLAVLYRARFKR